MQKIKKAFAFLLSFIILVSVFTGIMPASAMDLSQKYEVSGDYTLTDEEGNTFSFCAGLNAQDNPYGYNISAVRKDMHDYTVKRLGLGSDRSQWVYGRDFVYAFCIERGIPIDNYTEYTGSSNPNHGNKWMAMSEVQRELIMLILSYGYPNRTDLKTSKDANACYSATQLLVWQVAMGFRTSATQLNDKTYPGSGYSGTMTEQLNRNPYFKHYYDKILADVQRHDIKPSFVGVAANASTYEMHYSNGQYKLTLTDTNNVLSDFYVSDSAGLSASISGNMLTLTSSSPITSEKTITLTRRMPRTTDTTGFLIWSVPGRENGNQDMVSGVDNDPQNFYLKVKSSTGDMSIIKTTQHNNGSVSGFQFEIRNSTGGLVGTYTSNASGKIDIPNLQAGTYTVKEINLGMDFVAPVNNPQTVEVKPGQTASVSFDNIKKRGVITVQKSNANPSMGNYSLKGAVFEVRDQGGALVDTITTNDSGVATTKVLPLGVYRIKEVTAPYGFVLNGNTYTATISGSQGSDAIVYTPKTAIPETPQAGIIKIEKTNANPSMGNYSLKGAVFEVRNKATGELMDTVTTNDDGYAKTKELPLGAYVVTEKNAPYGFVLNTNAYDVTLSYAGDRVAVTYSDVTILEKPQVGTISVTKLDVITGTTTQGDSTLSGAVFEIWNRDKTQVVDTLYCRSDSSATSKELPLGNYFYREKTPPVGYTHDDAYHPISIEYEGQNVSVVKRYGDVENKVIEGKIALVKHTDEPDEDVDPSNPQVEQPLEGAIFQIYLKSAGSYENAKETERDLLTTNSNGYCESKLLPYGVYTVREISSPEDTKLVDPFDVFINEEGRIYRYILNDPHFRSLVKVVKVDSETGRSIPAAGITFKIWDVAAGDWVTQSYNYPTPTTLTEFQTAEDGTLVFPEPLISGDYLLYEISGSYGYVLTKEPVPFTVHSSQADPAIAEVILANLPAKGTIIIHKTGELLTGVQKTATICGTQYIPVFEQIPASGQVFEIIAAADIYTPDGTLRCAKGTVADTVTIADGRGESKQLYLGDYIVIEKSTVEPFVLNRAEYSVSLVYENENVAVVHSGLTVENERQSVTIELQKIAEEPENAPEDYEKYADILFGVYADQDILAADGSVAIPKDALLELITVSETGTAALRTDFPLGKFYIKELACREGYVLSPEKIEFEFKWQEDGGETVQIYINDSEAIENRLQRGSLKIIKTFEGTETPIAGIPFRITGVTTVGTSVTIKAETDENGEIMLENLLVGEYTVQELECDLAVGYVLSDAQTEIVAHEQLIEMKLQNELQRGSLRIIKGFEGKDEPVSGVKFRVWGTSIAGIEYDEIHETDKDGIILIENLPVGEYRVAELASDETEGYLLTGEMTAVVPYNSFAELGIDNILIRGNARLIKLDNSGNRLAGAVFELYDPDGMLIGEYTTDENGEIFVEGLAYGKGYKWVEIKSPNGFMIDVKEYSFDITEDGKPVEVTATNLLIPQTGDTGVLPYLLLMLASTAGVAATAIAGRKRRKI